jgi:hypothetical protein
VQKVQASRTEKPAVSVGAVSVQFGEWLPDQPPLGNPGLTRAENVFPCDGAYRALPTATATAGTLPATPLGGISFPIGVLGPQAYGALIGTGNLLLRLATTGSFATVGSAYSTVSAINGTYWRMAQFDTDIVATNGIDQVQVYPINGASATALASGTAPVAAQVGVIGKFLFLGDLATDPYAVQWSGIDAITSWPTPNSATATAQQSGLQVMPAQGGTVTGIANGDQFGIIFQRNRISRVSYAGPPVVFQFDTIDDTRGCFFPNSLVEVGGKKYFAAAFGFYVTDGVSVQPISDGKCTKQFFQSLNYLTSNDVYGAVDHDKKIIMWAFDTGMAIYNYIENKWTYTTQTSEFILTGIAPT